MTSMLTMILSLFYRRHDASDLIGATPYLGS